MTSGFNPYGGQQDQYRGSSYPSFAGGTTNSSGDYVPASTNVNPQPPAATPLPTTGLKNQQPSQLSNSLLQAAGPLASVGIQGGKALYNNWSGIFGSGTDPATGTALDASTAAATPSFADGALDGAPILSQAPSDSGFLAGDPILQGAPGATTTGTGAVDSLGVSGGVADAPVTQSGGLLGNSVGASGGQGVATSTGTGTGATEAVGDGATDTAAEGATDVGEGATEEVGADTGAEAVGEGATEEVGEEAAADTAADTGIGDALAEIGETIAEVVASVICTELLRQGKITYDDRELDIFFINNFLSQTHYDGYIWWAPTYVKLMQLRGVRGKLFTAWAHLCFEGRQRDIKRKLGISKQGSIFGRVVRVIGEPMCYFIGATRSIHQPTHAFAGD